MQPASQSTNTAPVCSGSTSSLAKSSRSSGGNNVIILLFISVCCVQWIQFHVHIGCIHGEPSLLTKSRRVVGEMLKYVIAASSRAFFARLRLNGGATETGLAVINDGGNAFDGPCKNLLAKGWCWFYGTQNGRWFKILGSNEGRGDEGWMHRGGHSYSHCTRLCMKR